MLGHEARDVALDVNRDALVPELGKQGVPQFADGLDFVAVEILLGGGQGLPGILDPIINGLIILGRTLEFGEQFFGKNTVYLGFIPELVIIVLEVSAVFDLFPGLLQVVLDPGQVLCRKPVLS